MIDPTNPMTTPDRCSQSVRTLSRGNLIDSADRCPVCQTVPLRGKQTVCSGKCRMARSRQRRHTKWQERDARVGLLLRTVIETAQDALALLEPRK